MGYDLDDNTAYNNCVSKLKHPDTENFVVRFNSDNAHCGVDVDQQEAIAWLHSDHRLPSQPVWFNFWACDSQRPIIAAVAKKYDLSPRLSALFCPPRSLRTMIKNPASPCATASNGVATGTTQIPSTDLEKGISIPSQRVLGQQQPVASGGLEALSFADVVNNLWHFCSVDFGRHYIYVGFNALFSLPGSDDNNESDKPSGQKIWTSLLFCDDGTVVSVFESPTDPTATAVTRRNVLNIFRHLSKLHDKDGGAALDTLMKVRVRWNEQSSKSGNEYSATEAASLLLYYLFDDWLSTYALIARVEHPYRRRLEELRQLMFEAADVSLIKQVHDVGRQLTVLKLMYQSYELIVSRLLYRHRLSVVHANANANTFSPGNDSWEHLRSDDMSGPAQDALLSSWGEESHLSVKLSLSAIVRFERLLDRIRLYALTEIEECLKEKESLVLMNFNLVALKESQAVERLTRTTILLAKATILFLPVSLMTAYFSVQLPEITELYTLKTYWLTFLVVAILSIAFLLVFGVTTHTVEGKTIYKSITRMLWDKGKSKRKKQ
ncbi:hypothetical protein A1O1_05338 [Capronia coronata CBS 617.96]|uniref:ADP-ribosylation factor n=1 Tax=Capronia coronata CBS 617.96 TaxID=1182541 RepID=W9Y7C6_9EURO|nr:uncharacterized protein A1O1_05338 [Capronia coronata CBS 617.96]EXJ88408.1 hypothetical protein A1O1_05338 [Capronia coronata CBS 617.96]